MKIPPYAYINGKIVKSSDAVVSLYDRGFLYGYGLFETIRAYNYTPFRLTDHLQRMMASAKHFNIRYTISQDKLQRDITELLRRNKLRNAYVRIMLSAGVEDGKPILSVITKPLPPLPKDCYEKGVRVELAKWHKNTTSPLHGHKTLNYLENVLSREKAQRHDVFEIIFTDEKGNILEGSCSNIFIVKNGKLYTPKVQSGNKRNVLPGITRKVVFMLAAKSRIPIIERQLRIGDVLSADEAFITNSLIEIMPVSHLGKRKIGRKEQFTTPILTRLYRSAVKRECYYRI